MGNPFDNPSKHARAAMSRTGATEIIRQHMKPLEVGDVACTLPAVQNRQTKTKAYNVAKQLGFRVSCMKDEEGVYWVKRTE